MVVFGARGCALAPPRCDMDSVYGAASLPSWGWYDSERERYVQPSRPSARSSEGDGGYTHTLVFLLNSRQVLLGLKRRGFGAGLYNGLGGKLCAGETARQCAMRECLEEATVTPALTFTGRINITVQQGESISIALFKAPLTASTIREMKQSQEVDPRIFAIKDQGWWEQTRPELRIYFQILLHPLDSQSEETLFTLDIEFNKEPTKDQLPPNERPENHRTPKQWSLTLHNSA